MDYRIKDLGSDVSVTVSADAVRAFKNRWPASGLPNRAITFRFQKSNGDLVDIHPSSVDGEAAVALSQDAWQETMKRHDFKRGQIVNTAFGRAKVIRALGPTWDDDILVEYGNKKRTQIKALDLNRPEIRPYLYEPTPYPTKGGTMAAAKTKKSGKVLIRTPFLTFVERGEMLYLEPTPEGVEAAKDLREGDHSTQYALSEMLEYARGNGWDYVPPEDIGALTDAEIISQDGFIGDDGHWYPHPDVKKPAVYAFMNYAVEDPIETWSTGKAVKFVKEVIEWTPEGRKTAKREWQRGSGLGAAKGKTKKVKKAASDVLTIYEIAKKLELPEYDDFEENNHEYVWEAGNAYREQAISDGLSEDDAEQRRYKGEEEAQKELFHNWSSAVERAAEEIWGFHHLYVNETAKGHWQVLPKVGQTWADVARQIAITINGIGSVEVSAEEYTRNPRTWVLGHLGAMKYQPDVYGTASAERIYEQSFR